MSKKNEEAQPLRVYIEYDSDESGGEPEDPNDRWTSHADTVINVSFKKLYREQPKHRYFYDSVEIDARHAQDA